MSTIQSTYEVDSEAYTQSVYPVDIDAPTKVISETVETIVEVANSTITVTTTHGIPQKEPYDSHTVNDVKSKDPHTATIACMGSMTALSVIAFIFFFIKWKRTSGETALERN